MRRLAAVLGGGPAGIGRGQVRVESFLCSLPPHVDCRLPGLPPPSTYAPPNPAPLLLNANICRASHVLWPPARWGALAPQPSPCGTRVVGKAGSLEILAPPSEEDDWWG